MVSHSRFGRTRSALDPAVMPKQLRNLKSRPFDHVQRFAAWRKYVQRVNAGAQAWPCLLVRAAAFTDYGDPRLIKA